MATDRISPATKWKGITAGANAIEPTPVNIYAGGAGDITAVGADGNSEVFTVVAGQTLPIQPVKITASTASGLIALYND